MCQLFNSREGPKGREFIGDVPTTAELKRVMNSPTPPPSRKNQRWPHLLELFQTDPAAAEVFEEMPELPDFSDAMSHIQEILQARKTEYGGYASTETAKRLIGDANRGKPVWNVGIDRSDFEKSNIARGVKNKNDELVLRGLEKYNSKRPQSEQLTLADVEQMRKDIKKAQNKLGKLKKKPVVDPIALAEAQAKVDTMVAIRDLICNLNDKCARQKVLP
ncbi:hypothetical protein IV203_026230 [Nitzschia inconspicua]|uniref:Uncharacterized protein n=1 Tax=Nitzschia inconspicua TaxID=303405 RepID=A0A9K3LI81_9STRA|nr:hypothetical protein IV203_026230 [Nitzschia inconspicua]